MNPIYPIYVISKGRWQYNQTSKNLDLIGVPHAVVIEPQEYDKYSKVISNDKILVLPFSNLGKGSIPARNYVWRHSKSIGAERHWILDDNIYYFQRVNRNVRNRVYDGTIFRVIEIFTDRYENIGLSGMNYQMFVPCKSQMPPFYLNTRIYSCILVNNGIPFRWRGKYNEDTDLSLRVLKIGLCTVLFNAFVARKITTMTMKGGNTDELYQDDGRLKMSESLAKQHPDCVKVSWKFNRYQHYVDYSQFKKNKLILKPGLVIPKGVNNYGMVLVDDHDEATL